MKTFMSSVLCSNWVVVTHSCRSSFIYFNKLNRVERLVQPTMRLQKPRPWLLTNISLYLLFRIYQWPDRSLFTFSIHVSSLQCIGSKYDTIVLGRREQFKTLVRLLIVPQVPLVHITSSINKQRRKYNCLFGSIIGKVYFHQNRWLCRKNDVYQFSA